ncbi:MAG: hypothetical protein JJ974_09890 [Phycisphaerales bacterium]|nr:hypothetical protein [Phycisphaerales bacterium]
MKRFLDTIRTKAKAIVVGVAVAAPAAIASAQTTLPEPVEMGDVVFPITPESIANSISAAGGEMIGRYAVIAIGFSLVFLFLRRLRGAV